ncbi:unnamed protein product [Caenorhabditis nigoni]
MSCPVTVTLSPTQDALWKLFHTEVNEMIVTRAGRNFFPKMEYTVSGLNPIKMYAIMVQMELVGDNRYKYSNGQWAVSGKADYQHEVSKKTWHADGVRTGKEWMESMISFDRLKITNNLKATGAAMIPLHSMHKYVPVLTIYEAPSQSPFCPSTSSQPLVTVKIPYTEFIAVTAYQNQKIVTMKIEHNSYAKGFRKDNKENRKRRSSSILDYSTDESTSKSSSPKCPRITPSPPEIQAAMNFQPTPATQLPFNPFLFPFNNLLASGALPFPMFSFGFPQINQLNALPLPNDSDEEASVMKIKLPEIKEETTETNIDIVN